MGDLVDIGFVDVYVKGYGCGDDQFVFVLKLGFDGVVGFGFYVVVIGDGGQVGIVQCCCQCFGFGVCVVIDDV